MTLIRQTVKQTTAAILLLLTGVPACWAQEAAAAVDESLIASSRAQQARDLGVAGEFRALDEEVQELKEEVLDLNRDLFLLEEELLFPANSQVAFFVSMNVGNYFELDAVSLKVDGKEVANYLYTEREVDALIRGGVHRMHLENLKVGEHELVAVFTGKGPHWRDYRRGATLQLDKGIGAKYVELQITDRVQKQQPEFQIKEWE